MYNYTSQNLVPVSKTAVPGKRALKIGSDIFVADPMKIALHGNAYIGYINNEGVFVQNFSQQSVISDSSESSSKTYYTFSSQPSIRSGIVVSTSRIVPPGQYWEDVTIVQYGHLYVYGEASGITILDLGQLSVLQGGSAIAVSAPLNGNNRIDVFDGGFVDNISGGLLYISSGGTSINTANCHNHILSGAYASNINVQSEGGYLQLGSGGTALGVNLQIGQAHIQLDQDTIAQGTVGSDSLQIDGTLSNYDIPARVRYIIPQSVVISGINIKSAGRLDIQSKATCIDAIISSGGSLCVSNGGTATDINAAQGAELEFNIDQNTYIQGVSNGIPFSISGGLASGISMPQLIVHSGCSLVNCSAQSIRCGSGAVINDCSAVSLYNHEGTAVNISAVTSLFGSYKSILSNVHMSSGFISLDSNVICNSLVIDSGTQLLINFDSNTNIQAIYGGSSLVISDGYVSGLSVYGIRAVRGVQINSCYASQIRISGATANDCSAIAFYVTSDGVANNPNILSGGTLTVVAGGTVTNLSSSTSCVYNILYGAHVTYI